MRAIAGNILGTAVLFGLMLVIAWGLSELLEVPFDRALLLVLVYSSAQIHWHQTDRTDDQESQT